MRIAHVVSTFPPYYGGMGRVAFETASALISAGEDVTVFTPMYPARPEEGTEEERKRFDEQNTFVRRLSPSLSYGNAATLPALRKELVDFDIVHLHYPFFGAGRAILGWKKDHPEKKLVITYHMDTRASNWKGIIFALYAKFFLPKLLAVADACITASFDYVLASAVASHMKQHESLWHQIPFGVRTDKFVPRESSGLRESLDIHVDTTVFLFVGGMDAAHYFKGVPILLDALCAIKDVAEWTAVFVGDGELREGLELRAQGLGIGKRVRFVGSITDEELPVYYSMADLTVLPSTTRAEAFGMVLIESFACGTPVLASDLPGVRMVAQSAGKVCAPGDRRSLSEALAGFLNTGAEERGQYRVAARAAALERYSVIRVAKEHIALYDSLFSTEG